MGNNRVSLADLSGTRMRLLWLALLTIQLVLLSVALVDVVRGVPDSYHNEHMRSVFSAVSGTLLCTACLSKPRIMWWLLAATFVSVGVQFWLMQPIAIDQ